MLQGIIFDMDGVMIDTEKLYLRFWREAAAEMGYTMEEKHVLSIRSLAAKYAEPKLKEYFGADFNYQKIRARRKELMDSYIKEHGIETKQGVRELLVFLKEHGYKTSVATATDLERTQRYLKSVDLLQYFDKIVCASMVENGKPEPDIYLRAAKELELLPENCIALEDSPNGILSACRAGCMPVMVPDLDEPSEETKKLLFALEENLYKVIDLIKKMEEEER